MSRDNLSLKGMKEYAETKDGIPNTRDYSDLRALEDLINEMDDIRSGDSTAGCSSHGNEVPSEYGEDMTVCSHSFSYTERSVAQIRDAIDGLNSCDCDSYQKMYCDCDDNEEWCNCNPHY